MQNQAILYGVIGLLGGSLLTLLLATSAVNNNNQGMMRIMGMRPMFQEQEKIQDRQGGRGMMGMSSSMDEMMDSLNDKSSDDFDKAFISAMIVHHQGAINMAEEARENAKHQELKDMAEEIISAQTNEIDQMRDWQREWGY